MPGCRDEASATSTKTLRQSGDSDPCGNEKFFGLSRQARGRVGRDPVDQVLRSTLSGESWRTLLQTFRTRIFVTLSDEASSKLGSEAGGQAERLKEQSSISESTVGRGAAQRARWRREGNLRSYEVVRAATGSSVSAGGVRGAAQRAIDHRGL